MHSKLISEGSMCPRTLFIYVLSVSLSLPFALFLSFLLRFPLFLSVSHLFSLFLFLMRAVSGGVRTLPWQCPQCAPPPALDLRERAKLQQMKHMLARATPASFSVVGDLAGLVTASVLRASLQCSECASSESRFRRL